MKKLSVAALSLATLFSLGSCKGHLKKVIVYANSDIQVDNTKTNITVGEGSPHREQELEFTGSGPVTLNVQTASGKITLDVPEDGLYIANLKTDTVIGSYQRTGAGTGDSHITQESLKQKLDSLTLLVKNENVNAANRNFFILPNHIQKLSANAKGTVYGPFKVIPSSLDLSADAEIYKFYSVKEIHDVISKLTAMSGGAPAPAATPA
ncbi:MAG TPA: hypothetical protein VHD83_13160, partial [Puia sp.]|nr:hypothetical protein [Puia sp.]